jgi:hypothetical protein
MGDVLLEQSQRRRTGLLLIDKHHASEAFCGEEK